MDIEESIHSALQSEAQAWKAPQTLDAKVRRAYRDQFRAAPKRRSSLKLMVALLVILTVIAPTSVLAFSSLADEIYGSFDTLKKNIASATMQEFTAFGMKLSGAKSQLGNLEYAKFIKLLKKFTAFRIENGKSFQIDDTALTAEKRLEYKRLLADLQPYFDKLNGELSSRDVLTTDEFDAYMEAQIVYSRIAYRLDISRGAVRPEQVPLELKDDYDHAKEVLERVSKKTAVDKKYSLPVRHLNQ